VGQSSRFCRASLGSAWRGAALSVLALPACGPVVRGGETVPTTATLGEVVASYDPVPCQDASGASADWRTRLFVVREPSGDEVLVEARAQYDSLVYQSSFADGDLRVYQVAVRSRGEPPRLHEARIPVSGAEGGSFLVAALQQGRGRGDQFRGRAGTVAIRCELTRVSESESVDKAPTTSKLPPS
jgi:hypothetical protein